MKRTIIHTRSGKKEYIDALKLFGVLAIILCVGPLKAADTSLFNWGELIHQLRAGYAVNQHGEKGPVYYTNIITVHNGNAVDLLSLNAGYEGSTKHPTIAIGMRFDNMIPLFFNNAWGEKHISVSKLPTFECGPFVSAWPKTGDNFWDMAVNYGVIAALGF